MLRRSPRLAEPLHQIAVSAGQVHFTKLVLKKRIDLLRVALGSDPGQAGVAHGLGEAGAQRQPAYRVAAQANAVTVATKKNQIGVAQNRLRRRSYDDSSPALDPRSRRFRVRAVEGHPFRVVDSGIETLAAAADSRLSGQAGLADAGACVPSEIAPGTPDRAA